jgi:hypothetical protein
MLYEKGTESGGSLRKMAELPKDKSEVSSAFCCSKFCARRTNFYENGSIKTYSSRFNAWNISIYPAISGLLSLR